jgi:hypothetical protein
MVVIVTVTSAGVVVASASQIWFTEDLYPTTRGYDTAWGKGLVALASLAVLSVLTGPVVGRRLWIFELLVGIAGLGVVIAVSVTHQPHFTNDRWLVEGWYWVALAATICWAIAAGSGALFARGADVSVLRWLWNSLRRDPRPPHTRVTLAFIGAFASALLLLLGALGPWQATPGYSLSGLTNSQDGMLVLGAAFAALLGLVSYWRLGSRRALVEVVVLSAAAGALSIVDLRDIDKSDVASGWGINLDAASSVALALFAIRMFARARSVITPFPIVESTPVDPEPTESGATSPPGTLAGAEPIDRTAR